jgi:hypothetical protein
MAGVPVIVADLLREWYGKLLFKVRWNNKLSVQYPVGSGVEQGSCQPPAIFNVFINAFIIQLRSSCIVCVSTVSRQFTIC